MSIISGNKKLIIAIVALLTLCLGIATYFIIEKVVDGESNLVYVFEIVRHGARAPLLGSEAFPV